MTTRGPYGVAHYKGKKRRAHRVVWEEANGKTIPEGLCVRHSCDNPPCCNPAHLLLGTNKDNVRDRVRRGREPRGEDRARAKLTNRSVREMRARAKGGARVRALAKEFGVAPATVSRAIRGENWSHVK